ncbi:hypothetical protein QVD17_38414 [Tagetes erecta]|uniref:Uncharacterized protein n=1 Tax=Tagetes erecta TaxID=13708 RepID=A0AAD8JNF5_TARER|nr:hypothetical protein QVD17_38414 [Tagetes erecta]
MPILTRPPHHDIDNVATTALPTIVFGDVAVTDLPATDIVFCAGDSGVADVGAAESGAANGGRTDISVADPHRLVAFVVVVSGVVRAHDASAAVVLPSFAFVALHRRIYGAPVLESVACTFSALLFCFLQLCMAESLVSLIS